MKENWKGSSITAALNFLKDHPETKRIHDPSSSRPALHFAIEHWNTVIVKELVGLMTEEELGEILDPSGRTALCCAIDFSGTEILECMVEKNKKLLSMVDPSTNMIPLVKAHGSNQWRAKEVTDYLYSITPLETLNAHQAAQIISQGFIHERFGTFETLSIHLPPS